MTFQHDICTWRKDEELRSEEYDLAFFSGLMKAGSAESEDRSLEFLVFRWNMKHALHLSSGKFCMNIIKRIFHPFFLYRGKNLHAKLIMWEFVRTCPIKRRVGFLKKNSSWRNYLDVPPLNIPFYMPFHWKMLTTLNSQLREGLEKRYLCIFSAAYPDVRRRGL